MPDLREDVRMYFDRLVETAEAVTVLPRRSSAPPVARRRVRAHAVVAVVAAFLLLAAIVVAVGLVTGRGGSDPRPLGTTPTTAPPPTTTEVPKRCGASLPFEPNVPDGFTGPLAGPAPGNPTPPASLDQLVVHWTNGSTSVEYRWPADDDGPFGAVDDLPADGKVMLTSATLGFVQGPDASGRHTADSYYSLQAPEGCHVVSGVLSGTDRADVDAVWQRFFDKLVVEHGTLVVGDETVDAEPAVTRCHAPAGVAVPPNAGGPTDAGSPRHATPEAALQAFVDENPGQRPFDYVAMHLPDGSVAFAVREPALDAFVTVVHVQPDGDRWWVDRWEAAGC